MKEEYFVIVNLYDLAYQKNGSAATLKEADKFETLEKAKKWISNFDEDVDLRIYKITETKHIYVEKVEE